MAVNPEGIDAAPLPDQTAVMSYFSSNGNDNRSKALGIALGIGMDEDRVAQGSLRKCAKKLGLIAEGQYTQEEYFDVRDPDVSWGTVEIRNIVAEALSVMGEGYISGKETVSERKTNLKRLDQEQLRLICKRHESNNLLFFLGPSNGFGEQYPWPHSMYATSRTFWEFSLTRALGLLVGNITYLRDPASPNSIVAQGRPMVFSGGYTNLMLMKYMFADVWEVRNLSKFSGIERRPGWFEPVGRSHTDLPKSSPLLYWPSLLLYCCSPSLCSFCATHEFQPLAEIPQLVPVEWILRVGAEL